jgi:hypothetical protein
MLLAGFSGRTARAVRRVFEPVPLLLLKETLYSQAVAFCTYTLRVGCVHLLAFLSPLLFAVASPPIDRVFSAWLHDGYARGFMADGIEGYVILERKC